MQRAVLWDVVPVADEKGIQRLPKPVIGTAHPPAAFDQTAVAHTKTTPWAESSLRTKIAALFAKPTL